MSEKKEDPKKDDAKKDEHDKPKGKKGGAAGVIVGVVLSAVLAGGAAYGGAKAASKPGEHHEEPVEKPKYLPPGLTVPLEPFIANIADEEGKPHAIKVTIAIELAREAKEEEFKVFVPRVRDITLTYLRNQTFEQMTDQESTEKMKTELIEKWHSVGATAAQKVLITDLITQ